MKLSYLFIILLLSVSLFSSCVSDSRSTEDIISSLSESGISLPAGFDYYKTAPISSEGYISDAELGMLYYDSPEAPLELEATEDYHILISKAPKVFEIHIFKTIHSSDNDMIERMLTRRSDILTSPQINPSSSRFMCEVAKESAVFSNGNFVFLIAGDEISDITNAIEKIF